MIAADFDNDGRDEIFFNNLGEPNRLFRMLAGGGDPDICMLDPGEALNPDGFGTGAAVADIDGDGVLELLVAHGERALQPLSLYKARHATGHGWLRVQPLTRFGAPARGAAGFLPRWVPARPTPQQRTIRRRIRDVPAARISTRSSLRRTPRPLLPRPPGRRLERPPCR